MTEHNYRLSGNGKTVREAEASLRDDKKTLTGKLRRGKVSTRLAVVGADYSADFKLKSGVEAEGTPVSFRQEGHTSFSDLRRDASRTANLRKYDARYGVTQYFQLTEEQLAATRETQTPAGRPYSEGSSLDRLGNW